MTTKYKFADIEIGEYFKEESEHVAETFQKISDYDAVGVEDGQEYSAKQFGNSRDWVIVG